MNKKFLEKTPQKLELERGTGVERGTWKGGYYFVLSVLPSIGIIWVEGLWDILIYFFICKNNI